MIEKVWFKNSKGLKLSGLIIKPKGRGPFPLIINVHGFFSEGKQSIKARNYIKLFPKQGFAVFIFDFEAYGESQGKFENLTISKEIDDLKSAVNFIFRKKYVNKNRVGLVASSLGGMIAILYAAKSKLISSLVLISPFSDLKNLSIVKPMAKQWQNMGYLHLDIAGRRKKLNYNFYSDGLKHDVFGGARNIHCPVMIIQAEKDAVVSPKVTEELFSYFDGPKKFVIVKEADHFFKGKGQLEQILKNAKFWFGQHLKKRIDGGIICIVQKKDSKILLLKRSDKVGFHPDFWYGIGGFLDDEKPTQVAKKEAFEELGIESKYLRLVKIGKPFHQINKKIDRHWFVYPVLIKSRKTKIKLNWEHTDYRWIKAGAFNKFKTVSVLKMGLKRLGLI